MKSPEELEKTPLESVFLDVHHFHSSHVALPNTTVYKGECFKVQTALLDVKRNWELENTTRQVTKKVQKYKSVVHSWRLYFIPVSSTPSGLSVPH